MDAGQNDTNSNTGTYRFYTDNSFNYNNMLDIFTLSNKQFNNLTR